MQYFAIPGELVDELHSYLTTKALPFAETEKLVLGLRKLQPVRIGTAKPQGDNPINKENPAVPPVNPPEPTTPEVPNQVKDGQ